MSNHEPPFPPGGQPPGGQPPGWQPPGGQGGAGGPGGYEYGYQPQEQPPYVQPTPGYSGYGGYGPQLDRGQTGLALALSIAGLTMVLITGCCWFAAPIIAALPLGLAGGGVYIGRREMKLIEAGQVDPAAKGNANAAMIIGIIALALLGLLLIGWALWWFGLALGGLG